MRTLLLRIYFVHSQYLLFSSGVAPERNGSVFRAELKGFSANADDDDLTLLNSYFPYNLARGHNTTLMRTRLDGRRQVGTK